jgi:hypothetical protein
MTLPVLLDSSATAKVVGVNPLSDLNGDGKDEFATTIEATSGANTIRLYIGQASATLGTSLEFQGQSSSLFTRFAYQVASGDYDGDGKGDIAILENAETSSQTVSGTVYIFSNVSSLAASPGPIALSEADVTIYSDPAKGIIDAVSPSPFLDLDLDGVSDLVLGASHADVISDEYVESAGRIFVVFGSRGANVDVTSLDTQRIGGTPVPGVGQFLTGNSSTWQSIDLTDNLASLQEQKWYTFTTLGDGLPGNYLQVTNGPIEAAEAHLVLGESIKNGPVIGEVSIGSQDAGILEFDVSNWQTLLDAAGQDVADAIANSDVTINIGYHISLASTSDVPLSLQIELIAEEGDGSVDAYDAWAPAQVLGTFGISNGDKQVLHFSTKDAGDEVATNIRKAGFEALSSGKSRLAIRITHAGSPGDFVQIEASAHRTDLGSPDY